MPLNDHETATLKLMADVYQVTPGEILARSREMRIIRPRHAFCLLLRQRGYSSPRASESAASTQRQSATSGDAARSVAAMRWTRSAPIA